MGKRILMDVKRDGKYTRIQKNFKLSSKYNKQFNELLQSKLTCIASSLLRKKYMTSTKKPILLPSWHSPKAQVGFTDIFTLY